MIRGDGEAQAGPGQVLVEAVDGLLQPVRRLGLNENLIRNWKQALQTNGEHAFPGHGNLSPLEEENRRLREENKRLLAERDILKKAAAFFAREAT